MAGVGVVVESLPRTLVLKPEVRSEVDDALVGGQRTSQCRRFAMGQGEEDDVCSAQRVGVRGDQGPIGEGRQLRMHLTQATPRLGSRGNGTHLELGVSQ